MNENNPIFSLVYTSVRPAYIPQVIKLWNERSTLKAHEWCIGVDAGDRATEDAVMCAKMARLGKVPGCDADVELVINEGPKTCVAGWNIAATAAKGKVMIAVADDFLPPSGWDSLLLSLEPKGWEDGEYVVKVSDGCNATIFTLSILTRKRYERFGYMFYPKYPSMFNDTEFGEVAKRDGVVIFAEHLLFEHLHPSVGKRPHDNVDTVHASQSRWDVGEQLFNFRQKQGFPVDDGPLAARYAEAARMEQACRDQLPPVSDKYVAYMQVIKDDFCLMEVCQRLVDEGVHDFCFCQPDEYWSGEAVDGLEVTTVKETAQQLQATGQTVHWKMFKVAEARLPGDTRITVETRVRNEGLVWMRSLGYRHILIVDGDELWIPGTFAVIKDYVEQGHLAISVRMIPVIGLPGYPVEGATDVAVVYVGGTVTFKACRSPYINQTLVYKPMIYHFTGTRRTMEETVKKHRRGGHYDDPDYAFEPWIANVLPSIKPGMKNAHMYTPRQVWPSVRAWQLGELARLPVTLHPFLGGETQS
jgi:hypothetical protein